VLLWLLRMPVCLMCLWKKQSVVLTFHSSFSRNFHRGNFMPTFHVWRFQSPRYTTAYIPRVLFSVSSKLARWCLPLTSDYTQWVQYGAQKTLHTRRNLWPPLLPALTRIGLSESLDMPKRLALASRGTTRSPAIATMADRTAPVVKLTLTQRAII